MTVQLLQNQLTIMQNPTQKEWDPKDLRSFSGKAEDWPIFKNEFNRNAPAGKMNSSQNAIRLRKALTWTAKDAVIGLLHEPRNVQEVMCMLELRFGRSELVIDSLIGKAEAAKSLDAGKPETFVQFGTTVLDLIETVR